MEWKSVLKSNFLGSIRNDTWRPFIDSALGAGLDIETRRNKSSTMLSLAVKFGDLKIVEYLVQKGADINAKNFDGTTPLHIAAKYSHQEVVDFLINLGVCVDSCDKNNRTPLHYVFETCRNDELDHHLLPLWDDPDDIISSYTMAAEICPDFVVHKNISYSLLANGANANASDSKGEVPLLLAATNSCVLAVKNLIVWGAKIDCYDTQKWTVLHFASLNGWLDVVRTLLEMGFDVNAKTSNGDTPIMLAIQNLHRDVFNLLVESGADMECQNADRITLLHFACRVGWLDTAQLLVERGFDVNAETSTGHVPLLLAAEYFKRHIVHMLLKSGAQLKCCNAKKWTLLHCACKAGWLDVVQSLVEAGFDINAKTRDNVTPLYIAADYSHMEIFRYLLDAGADVNIEIPIRSYYETMCEGDGAWTLLHHVCYKGWIEALMWIINKGFNVNEKSLGGDTPLHLAVKCGHLEIVICLLLEGADCNIKNNDNEIALHYFDSSDQPDAETIRLFIECGSYINRSDYHHLSKFPVFKDEVLKDAEMCTQAVINRFNAELKDLYEDPSTAKCLPPIERMKSSKNTAHCIEQSVKCEIETKGYCNIVEVRPLVLSLLSVTALYRSKNKQ